MAGAKKEIGAPLDYGRGGGTRTPDRRIRNPMLYPAELHPRLEERVLDVPTESSGPVIAGSSLRLRGMLHESALHIAPSALRPPERIYHEAGGNPKRHRSAG